MRNRLPYNHIVESDAMLPLCAAFCIGVWAWQNVTWCGGMQLLTLLGSFVAILATVYLIMETNNINQLIRIRTRMMASMWLLLVAAMPTMQLMGTPLLLALLSACFYYCLFHCYQRTDCMGWFFHAMLCIALGSLLFPQLLLFVVPCILYMTIFMRSMTTRILGAGLAGLVVPYLLWATGCFLTDDMGPLLHHFANFWGTADHLALSVTERPFVQQVGWGVMGFYTLVGVCHYWRNNYSDKIRTRQMLYVYVSQSILLHVLLALRPDCHQAIIAILTVTCTPLLVHYFAVSRSWWCFTLFVATVMSYLLLFYVDLWM